jgi:uncharacterized protein (DUF849 family)
MALIAGGGGRVGLEDNTFYDRDRKMLATTIGFLKRIIEAAKILDFEPHKVSELRNRLELEPK